MLQNSGGPRESAEQQVHGSGPREYYFFPDFPITRAFLAVFFIGLALVAWAPLLYLFLAEHTVYGPALRATLYLTATFILVLLLGRAGKRALERVSFLVSSDGIVRRDPYRIMSLAWNDVETLRCRRPLFMKPFVEISDGRRKLLLPSTISRFADLGIALRQCCVRAGKGELVTDEIVRKVTAMAAVSERWNRRSRAALLPIVAATVGTLLSSALVASVFWERAPLQVLVWTAMGLPVPLAVYSFADLRINRRHEYCLLSGIDFSEKRVLIAELRAAVLAGSLAYGLFGIVFKTIFLP